MIRLLIRSAGLLMGSVAVAGALLVCAVVGAVVVMFLGCQAVLLGPKKVPWLYEFLEAVVSRNFRS